MAIVSLGCRLSFGYFKPAVKRMLHVDVELFANKGNKLFTSRLQENCNFNSTGSGII